MIKPTIFIHAKGLSERIPRKNLEVVGNRPLIGHAIKHALDACNRVIIDSDDAKILEVGKEYGAKPIKRPAGMSRATGDELALYAAQCCNDDTNLIVQLLPTSPFITGESIKRGFKLAEEIDSVAAVRKEPLYIWKDNKPAYYTPDGIMLESQKMEPFVFETTGLYMVKKRYITKYKKRINCNSVAPLYISKIEAVDINTPEDLSFARLLWKALRKEQKSYGFDLDGTITLYDTKGDYEEAIPNYNMIEKINRLYDEGHFITITTSRGHSRGVRDIALQQARQQLADWNVKYHRLVEKPFYDKLIDDATETPENFFKDKDWETHLYSLLKFVPEGTTYSHYIGRHWPRFEPAIRAIMANVPLTPESQVIELASTLPFITYPLVRKFGIEPTIASIETTRKDIPPYKFRYCNLNHEWLPGGPKYDLIIATEIWEHLPCNMIEARDRVLSVLRSGGYLYTSFPTNGINAGWTKYHHNLDMSFETNYREHLREFTDTLANQFLNVPGLEIISENKVWMEDYQGYIRGILCRVANFK